MTRTLLRLQATMWKRTVSGNSAAIMMITLVTLYAIIGLVSFMVMLAQGLIGEATGILAGIVATGTIAYAIAAIMWPSGEGQLSPAAFSVMPIKARDALPALAISTVMQSRGILAVLCTVVTGIVSTIFYPPAMIPVVWMMLALALLITLLLGELISSFASGSSSRVGKERMSIYASLGFMVVIIAYQLLTTQGAAAHVDTFGGFARWTPFASAAGVIEAAVAGKWMMALVFFVLTLGYLVMGVWLWARFINQAMTAPLDGGPVTAQKTSESDPDARVLIPRGLPSTPFWAVYIRSLLYLIRDSRLLASLITIPMLGIIFLVQSYTVETYMIYVGLIFMAVFSGAIATNDFGYDGPSTWLNIISGAPTRSLVLGRHLAQMTPAVLIVVGYMIIALVVADDVLLTLLIMVITIGVLATTAGIALYATTFNPFATAKPGTSPWGDRSGYSGAAFVSAFATMFLGWIPSLPAIILTVYGSSSDVTWAVIVGQMLAVVIPGGLYALMIRVCLNRVDKRMPEIFNKVSHFVG